MSRHFALNAAFVLIAGVVAEAICAHAAPGFPSVKEFEAALDLHPGARIPQDLLIRGERYHAEYVGVEARPGGQYAIVVKLER